MTWIRRTTSNPRPRSLRSMLPRWGAPQSGHVEDDTLLRPRAVARIRLVGVVVTLGLAGLVLKSSSIMLVPDRQLSAKARDQFKEAPLVRGRRGDIRDREGTLLATSVTMAAAHADPSQIPAERIDEVAEAIAPILDLDPAAVARRLAAHQRRDVLLARDLTPDQVLSLKEAVTTLGRSDRSIRNAIFLREEQRRYYPGGSDATSLLGLVSRTGTALTGIERTLDFHLRGDTHRYVIWRDRKGRRVTPDTPWVRPGNNVVLTLNRRIQRITEDALDIVMSESNPVAAQAIVMDVSTGEILALANRPTHNPNVLSELRKAALRNRVVTDVYEPGSVFKPFVIAAALADGLVSPDSMIDCEYGQYRIGKNIIHDDHPKGVLSVTEVLTFSSNIGAAKLALKLGAKRTLAYLASFGFGRATGIGLNAEASGFLRRPNKIKPIELATIAYGHGVSASTMQLVSAIATLGNEGVRMKPMLIREILDHQGTEIRKDEPTVSTRVVPRRVARRVVEMMVTVTEKGGTGTRAAIPGYRVAGKTGTAWKHIGTGYSSTERIASFVGLVPADVPRLAIAVVVDSPRVGSRYGGIAAAPAFAKIAAGSLRQLGVPPDPTLMDDQTTTSSIEEEDALVATVSPELTWTQKRRLRAPDLTGLAMRDALLTLQGSGLHVSFRGTGRVVSQKPYPGGSVAQGGRVEVILQ